MVVGMVDAWVSLEVMKLMYDSSLNLLTHQRHQKNSAS